MPSNSTGSVVSQKNWLVKFAADVQMAHLGHSRLRTIVATVLFLLASAAAFSNPLNPPQQQQQVVARISSIVFAYSSNLRLQSVNLPQLSGLVDDCCCSVSDTQHVNDNYIARALDVLVKRKFFRFFKVKLDKDNNAAPLLLLQIHIDLLPPPSPPRSTWTKIARFGRSRKRAGRTVVATFATATPRRFPSPGGKLPVMQ